MEVMVLGWHWHSASYAGVHGEGYTHATELVQCLAIAKHTHVAMNVRDLMEYCRRGRKGDLTALCAVSGVCNQ